MEHGRRISISLSLVSSDVVRGSYATVSNRRSRACAELGVSPWFSSGGGMKIAK
jgi:hypothetical protein